MNGPDARRDMLLKELGDFNGEELRKICVSLKLENETLTRKIDMVIRDGRRIRDLDQASQIPLGFSLQRIAAESSGFITQRPQIAFKPVRLAVDPECAPFFSIYDLRVGKNTFHLCADEWAATLFPPIEEKDPEFKAKSKQLRIDIGTVQIGQDLTLCVRNTDQANPHDFRAVVWGYYLDFWMVFIEASHALARLVRWPHYLPVLKANDNALRWGYGWEAMCQGFRRARERGKRRLGK